jgi:hypothetical protein
MKTAMQEMIQWIVDRQFPVNKEFVEKTIELTMKEKEQIIDAFELGYKSCDIDEAFEIHRKLASGELYYDKTYNQNK